MLGIEMTAAVALGEEPSPAGAPVARNGGIDCAVDFGNGKAYFFRGAEYIRYDITKDIADPGFPKPITGGWLGLWDRNLDAAFNAGNGKVYFFRRDEYVRYDIAADRADPGFPKPIAGNWPGVWDRDIDAAFGAANGKAYFFKGGSYIRYDIAADRADAGFPKPIASKWPGVWDRDIDAAFNAGNGKAFFFRGNSYVRYDIIRDQGDAGYPLPVSGHWPGLWSLPEAPTITGVQSPTGGKCPSDQMLGVEGCTPWILGVPIAIPPLPPFRIATSGSNRGEILDGAVYDLDGNVVCVLSGDPGAYLFRSKTIPGYRPASLCPLLSSASLAGSLREPIGTLSNNDLLKRLVWLYGEGGCDEVETSCMGATPSCVTPGSTEYGSRHFAYAIKNLRASHKTDELMLRGGCKAKDKSGKVVSLYEPYFITGHSNTIDILRAVKDPASWTFNPTPPGVTPCTFGDNACFARRKAARCLADVILAEMDVADTRTPFSGRPNGWLGDVLKSRSATTGSVCSSSRERIVTRTYAGTRGGHCFRSL